MDIKLTDSLRSDILSQINDSIIMDNILEQINEISFKDIDKKEMNFIELYNNRYNSVYEIAEKEQDDKLMSMARDSRGRFYDNVAASIANLYGFSIDFRDNLMEEEIYETVSALYRFFVLEIYDNLSDYATDIIVNSKMNVIGANSNIKPDMLLTAMTEELGKENALVVYFLGNTLEGIDCGNLYEFVGRITRLDPL